MVLTGNPVRQDLIDIDGKRSKLFLFKLDPNKKTLLVLMEALCKKDKPVNRKELTNIQSQNVQVIWQESYITKSIKNIILQMFKFLFIERMDFFAAADIIISCRSFFGI
jgi:UDP-N-acetylglucosamine--N-acetylmuramyl-(pentapeptide) pyrophosphoryl-undecaprenol N-acetylglucosamine transferase